MMPDFAAWRRRRIAWSIGVYFQPALNVPPRGQPDALLLSRRALRLPGSPHTLADPCLFAHRDRLYMFYETQTADDFGRIAACELSDGKVREIGSVLSEPYHLSYPSVFAVGDDIFMIPESQGAHELRLYRFDRFPDRAVFVRTLLTGQYADPSPVLIDGLWYIFASSPHGLELFVTDDIVAGELHLHPRAPLTQDLRFRRCGGMPFMLDGQLVRPAQNCELSYGKNLSLLAIRTLTPDRFEEEPVLVDFLPMDAAWNASGGHHISVVPWQGGMAVAIDGQAPDPMHHKVLIRSWMLATGRKRRL